MPRPSKKNQAQKNNNGMPELLSHDSGTQRTEGEIVDCLSDVIAGTADGEVYGLGKGDDGVARARDLIAGLDGGVVAMARADAAREERENAEKLAEIDRAEQEAFAAQLAEKQTETITTGEPSTIVLEEPITGRTTTEPPPAPTEPEEPELEEPGEDATEEQQSAYALLAQEKHAKLQQRVLEGHTTTTGGKPIIMKADGSGPAKYQYQAAQREMRERLGIAGLTAVKVRTALGHLKNFGAEAKSWRVESQGLDPAANVMHPDSSLGALADAMILATETFAQALESIPASFKPAKVDRDGAPDSERSGSELHVGQVVWLRAKHHKTYADAFNTTSDLVVSKIAGKSYVCTVSDPKDGEPRVTLPRNVLKTSKVEKSAE